MPFLSDVFHKKCKSPDFKLDLNIFQGEYLHKERRKNVEQDEKKKREGYRRLLMKKFVDSKCEDCETL